MDHTQSRGWTSDRIGFWSGALMVMLALLITIPAIASAGKPSRATLTIDDGKFASTGMAYVGASGSKELRLASAEGSSAQYVLAECFQNGAIVYRQYSRVQSGQAAFTLGPTPSWSSGDAGCVAELGEFDKRNRWRGSTSVSFSVTD